MNPLLKTIASRYLPFGLPLAFGRLLAGLAVLFFATLALSLLGWTSIAGEPQAWAQVLAVISGSLLVLAVVAIVVLLRKVLGVVRQGKQLFRKLSTR